MATAPVRASITAWLLLAVSATLVESCSREAALPTRPNAVPLARPPAPTFDAGVNIATVLDSFSIGGVYSVTGKSGYPRLVGGALLYAKSPEAEVYAGAIRGHPTGIDLPAGLPIRVLAEGTVVSTATDAFHAGYCVGHGTDPICRMLDFRYSVHGLEPDTGVFYPYGEATGLQIEWSRLGPRTYAGYPFPEFFRGPVPGSGSSANAEVHFHRSAGCCYYIPLGEPNYPAWETYSGRWRLGAVPDDGGRVEFGEPSRLRMSGPRTDAPMAAPRTFALTAADGGSLSDVQWWFIEPANNVFDGVFPDSTASEPGTGFIVPAYRRARRTRITTLVDCGGQVTCLYRAQAAGAVVAKGRLADGAVLAASNRAGGAADPLPTIRIARAIGPNDSGSFLSRPGENLLVLEAAVGNSSQVTRVNWRVLDDPSDRVLSIPPGNVADGEHSRATVPPQDSTRFIGIGHRPNLGRLALSYIVRATALTPRDSVISEPVVVRQSAPDALRETYVEYGIPLPRVDWLRDNLPGTSPISFAALNNGDFAVAVIASYLPDTLAAFRTAVNSPITITSAFRDPFHYRRHVRPSGGARIYPRSVHQYGAAVDIATFNEAARWTRWRDIARTRFGACPEPRNISTLDHLHIDFRAVCPTEWLHAP